MCIRRLRASLWILKQTSPKLRIEKLDRDLRILGHQLGKIRELDVALQDATSYGQDPHSLVQKRKDLKKSIGHFLTVGRQKEIQTGIADLLSDLEKIENLNVKRALFKLRKKIDRWRGKEIHGEDDLHRLRMAFKKTRYVLEALNRPIGPLRKIQNALGRTHDLEVLEKFIGEHKHLSHDQKAMGKKAIRLSDSALKFAHSELRSG